MLAAAVFGLVACTSGTPGTANPTSGGGQGTTGGSPTTTAGSASGSGGGAPTLSLQPCNLPSASLLSQLQVTQSGGPSAEAGARTCTWQRPVDQNGVNGYVVGVDIRDSQGLADVNSNGYTVTQDNIGSHQAKQLKATGAGSCGVAVAVSAKSRVDLVATAGTDADMACQLANQLAQDVAPKLPSGS